MKRDRTNFSSAQKLAASVTAAIEAYTEAKATVNTCKQKLEDGLKKLGLRIVRHEDRIKSLLREDEGICEAMVDLQATLSQFHESERPMTEGGYHPNAVSEMAGKVDDGNINREEPVDDAFLKEIRKKVLVWEVLKDELQREMALLHNMKSKYLVKINEHLQCVDEGHQYMQAQVPGSSSAAKKAKLTPRDQAS